MGQQLCPQRHGNTPQCQMGTEWVIPARLSVWGTPGKVKRGPCAAEEVLPRCLKLLEKTSVSDLKQHSPKFQNQEVIILYDDCPQYIRMCSP